MHFGMPSVMFVGLQCICFDTHACPNSIIRLLTRGPSSTGSLQDVRSACVRRPLSDVAKEAYRSPKSLLGSQRKLVVVQLTKSQIADQSFCRVQHAAVTACEAAQSICDLWLPTEGPGQQISIPSSIRLRPCGHAVSQGVAI